MLVENPKLLKRALRLLAAIACEAQGEAKNLPIEGVVHALWGPVDSTGKRLLALTATDGHRALRVALLGPAADPSSKMRDCAFRCGVEGPHLIEDLTHFECGPERNPVLRFAGQAHGLQAVEGYPRATLDEYFNALVLSEKELREGGSGGIRALEVNPTYMHEGFQIVSSLLGLAAPDAAPRVHIIVPKATGEVTGLVTRWPPLSRTQKPEEHPATLRILYAVMPYVHKPTNTQANPPSPKAT